MTISSPREHRPLRGILYKLASVVAFVLMASLVKAAAAMGVPPGELVFFRSLCALPVILLWCLWQGGGLRSLRVVSPRAHILRGIMGTAAMACIFTGLGLVPLPEAVAIGYTTPLLVVVFAALFLGEKVGWVRVSAVLAGLLGVGIILSPRLGADGGLSGPGAFGAGILVLGAALAALTQVYIRHMVRTETTAATVFWFAVSASVMALASAPMGWVLPGPSAAAVLILAGLLGGVAQIFLTSGYRVAEASTVAPFEYASMLVSLVLGYAVFDETPTRQVLIGAAVVILAGVVIILRERRLGLERGKARPRMTPQG
ncbi:MAG: DMT family transporter [Rhodobacteraceae bacterium]|nr:DMT family transporter [Paracoccaceae bacterium]